MRIYLLVLCAGVMRMNAQLTDATPPQGIAAVNGPSQAQPAQPTGGRYGTSGRYSPGADGLYFPAAQSVEAQQAPPPPRTFSIEFPGGLPGDLIEHLREALKQPPNVMISPKMQEVALPAFKLQNVTLEDLFQALNGLAEESVGGTWQLSGSREPIWVLRPTFQGLVDPLTGAPLSPGNREVRVFPVGEFLGEFTVEDVTTSIQTAWEMMGGNSSGQIKFHKDTNLLIAVGTADQLKLLQEVLAALSNEVGWKKRATAEKPKASVAEPGVKAQ